MISAFFPHLHDLHTNLHICIRPHLPLISPTQCMFLHKHQSWLLRHICLVRVCHLFFGLECLLCCNLICSFSEVWFYAAKKKKDSCLLLLLGDPGRVSKAPSIDRNVCVAVSSLKTIKHQKSASNSNSENVAAFRKYYWSRAVMCLFLCKDDITGFVGLAYVQISKRPLCQKRLS